MKKYINRNSFWADLFVAQLLNLEIKHVCLSPGSRNTPLTLAFAQNKKFKKYSHIDERSCGFFALGIAKAIKKPVVIVTTSGTAVAELYPSIIEAYFQRIPLIICSADRPHFLRNTGANQTINQDNIFINHIRYFCDLGLPSVKSNKLKGFIKNISKGINISSLNDMGPIHFNFPFKKPFEPDQFTDKIPLNISDFVVPNPKEVVIVLDNKMAVLIEKLNSAHRPIIHCGWDNSNQNYNNDLLRLSTKHKIPILVDGASELRFTRKSNNTVISNHSAFLNQISKKPDLIICFGNAPTSKTMLKIYQTSGTNKILVNEHGDIKDPSRKKGILVKTNPIELLDKLLKLNTSQKWDNWFKYVKLMDKISENAKSVILNSSFGSEPRIINELLELIPISSKLFISNSLPIRDFDNFASVRKKNLKIYSNRGASGIDGIISTASGVSVNAKGSSFLVIGDLAFYHNITALFNLQKMKIPLKIILINNNGGGIFNMLPVVQQGSTFEKYFVNSHNINFAKIIKSFSGDYHCPKSWKGFRICFRKIMDSKEFSVIELKTNSKKSLELRNHYSAIVSNNIKLTDASLS